MRSLSRVVWTEGMQLSQHHFQEQCRYFEDLVSFSLTNLFFKPYGLAGCRLDAEALLNGTVSVVHARGVMPDGLPFYFPDDTPPDPLRIDAWVSPTRDSHLVLLAVPERRGGKANVAEGSDEPARYSPLAAQRPDEVTGRDERAILLARKNFALRLDSQANEGWATMPIARIRRDGSGRFVYDPEYIPPLLQVGASEPLLALLRRVLDRLEEKASSLAQEQPPRAQVEHSSGDVVGLWLAHAVHASYAPLRHHMQSLTNHPEELYLDLARLAGALCTFSLDAHLQDLPPYDHDHLDLCFGTLEQQVQRHLERVRPTNRVVIPLQRVDETFYEGDVGDARCFAGGHWFLGVRAGLDPVELSARVPRLVKICSAMFIRRLVQDAYPGLELEYVPSPPSDLSPRFDTRYFSVRGEGPCWVSVADTRRIGVFVPAALPGAELEISVVLPA